MSFEILFFLTFKDSKSDKVYFSWHSQGKYFIGYGKRATPDRPSQNITTKYVGDNWDAWDKIAEKKHKGYKEVFHQVSDEELETIDSVYHDFSKVFPDKVLMAILGA